MLKIGFRPIFQGLSTLGRQSNPYIRNCTYQNDLVVKFVKCAALLKVLFANAHISNVTKEIYGSLVLLSVYSSKKKAL